MTRNFLLDHKMCIFLCRVINNKLSRINYCRFIKSDYQDEYYGYDYHFQKKHRLLLERYTAYTFIMKNGVFLYNLLNYFVISILLAFVMIIPILAAFFDIRYGILLGLSLSKPWVAYMLTTRIK